MKSYLFNICLVGDFPFVIICSGSWCNNCSSTATLRINPTDLDLITKQKQQKSESGHQLQKNLRHVRGKFAAMITGGFIFILGAVF